MVVQGEVIAGDDVDTGILLDLPVLGTETLGLGQEVSLGEVASPVWPYIVSTIANRAVRNGVNYLQASVAFLRSRSFPMRGKPKTAD